ncbi:MAG: hypothetical protein HONDAALG_02014 [Gammaproteobacteria bacterium]|nr:hypothetical protein [Gammaproteobacteria bacterium]
MHGHVFRGVDPDPSLVCGRVAFEVEGTIEKAVSCNCSICQRKGTLLWFVPRE